MLIWIMRIVTVVLAIYMIGLFVLVFRDGHETSEKTANFDKLCYIGAAAVGAIAALTAYIPFGIVGSVVLVLLQLT